MFFLVCYINRFMIRFLKNENLAQIVLQMCRQYRKCTRFDGGYLGVHVNSVELDIDYYGNFDRNIFKKISSNPMTNYLAPIEDDVSFPGANAPKKLGEK